MARFYRPSAALLLVTLAGCVHLPGSRPVAGLAHGPAGAFPRVTVPIVLDNDRVFVELTFRRPDGRPRPALAWVNMGMGGLSLAPALRDELGGDGSVTLQIGDVPVTVERGAVLPISAAEFAQQVGPMPIEATLPAGILRLFRVTLDYPGRTLTLAPPGDAPAAGVAVPVTVSATTGLISVDAKIDGRIIPVVIDAGAGYSWWHGDSVRALLARHPGWLRSNGAAGASNQAMVDHAFEQDGTVIRVPTLDLGALTLRDVGLLGSGPAEGGVIGRFIGRVFWRAWGEAAAGPVIGWLGGNALSPYRLTVDYRNSRTYWLAEAPPRTDELNAVGISLVHTARGYRVGGLPNRADLPAARGIAVGDTLLAVDGRIAATMTRGAILAALHGTPGQQHALTLGRAGHVIGVAGLVAAYSDPPN